MVREFPAKVSWWLFGPILLLLLISAGSSVVDGAWPGTLITLGALALVLYVVLGTRYILHPHELLVRSGPFSWRVPVPAIREISRTHNPLSSPAPSLDRLRIRYHRYDSIMISPRDQAAFLTALTQLNPHIQIS